MERVSFKTRSSWSVSSPWVIEFGSVVQPDSKRAATLVWEMDASARKSIIHEQCAAAREHCIIRIAGGQQIRSGHDGLVGVDALEERHNDRLDALLRRVVVDHFKNPGSYSMFSSTPARDLAPVLSNN